MTRMFLTMGLIVFAACTVRGQSAAPSRFEVASIKPSDPAATRGARISMTPGGRFSTTNASLKSLIQAAYDVRSFLISGGPAWLDTQGYDIEAKGEALTVSADALGKMTEEQRRPFEELFRERLRTLLMDRFQLKVHWETKDLPVYGLIVAKNGPRLQAAKADGTPRESINVRADAGQTQITARGATLSPLTKTLADLVGRTVLDKTGLTGSFDFTVNFTSDLGQQPPGGGDPADGPSLFTAVQEQLGLKLDAQRGPVEVLVIDSAERASQN
jgi:uncharacterized protein (TIGR03435 family)